jgi:threonine/homoserine/homoserine lactone efflux protein
MVILVTSSGVLSPGPLFFGALLQGTKQGARAGLALSTGHMIIEFPLVLLLALGLLTIAAQPLVGHFIGLTGGAALIVFGFLQIREAVRIRSPETFAGRDRRSRGSLTLGLLLTGLNPFFIVWWLTVGGKVILDAVLLASLLGVLIMYASHIWMDYAWLTTVAYLAGRGRGLIGTRTYRLMLALFAIVLLYFGGVFVSSALQVTS